MKHLIFTFTMLFNSLALFGQYDVLYDSTFNGEGVVILPYSITADQGVHLQSDGKMVVLGAKVITNDSSVFTLLRLNADGALDGTYNNTGVNNDPTLFNDGAGKTGLLLPNDELIVGGVGLTTPWYSRSVILHKYRENGTKDELFGNAGAVIFTVDSLSLGCADLKVYDDNSFLVLFGGYFFGTDTVIERNFLCKLNTNGTIDSSFAINGILEIPHALITEVDKMVLSDDGSIYILGNYNYIDFYYTVIKLNADLTFDTGFNFVSSNNGGSSFSDIAIDDDGKIIVSSTDFDYSFKLYRLMPDGTLDKSFHKDGHFTGYLTFDAYLITQTIEQPNGKLLFQLRGGATALRANPNGTLDYSFDLDGIMEKIPGEENFNTFNYSSGMALQPDGKMIFMTETDTDLIKIVRLKTRP